MKEGLMLVDLHGTILYANKALEDLLHYEREELLGQSCNILQCNKCFGHDLSAKDTRCELFKKGDVSDLHCSFKCKDGTRVEVLKNATVLTDKNGIIVAGVETLTDLTTVMAKEKVICELRKELSQKRGFHGLIGNSSRMQQVYDLIETADQSNAP